MIKKEMINKNNPDRELRYIVIVDEGGGATQTEVAIDSGTADMDAAIATAKQACLVELGLA